jgi:hypothetical protein
MTLAARRAFRLGNRKLVGDVTVLARFAPRMETDFRYP